MELFVNRRIPRNIARIFILTSFHPSGFLAIRISKLINDPLINNNKICTCKLFDRDAFFVVTIYRLARFFFYETKGPIKTPNAARCSGTTKIREETVKRECHCTFRREIEPTEIPIYGDYCDTRAPDIPRRESCDMP